MFREEHIRIARLDIAGAREALKKTAYKGEPIVFLTVAGSISQTAGAVLADNMRKAGFTVDEQVMDWGTVLARRGKKEGWGIFPVYANGIDMMSPLTHFYIGNNCVNYPGWSVTVDGQPAPLYTAYSLLRAVPLAAGTHTVRFAFQPGSVLIGVTTSS